MRYVTRELVLAALGAAALGCGNPIAINDETHCDPEYEPVKQALRDGVSHLHLDGASLQIADHDVVVCTVYLGAFTSQTWVPIVSASKWLSAAAVLTLVDQGLLQLDDPIEKFLPQFSDRRGLITIRQLLSHTSGLPTYHPCLSVASMSMEECIGYVADDAPLFADPGRDFSYGALSFQIAGRIAEVASGELWEQFFADRIAGPLGLTSTDYFGFTNPVLAENARSTIADYGAFLDMILHDGVGPNGIVLSPAVLEEMRANQTAAAFEASTPRPGISYGLGVWRDRVDSTTGRAWQISSPGGGGFVPWVDYNRHIRGVFMTYDDLNRVWDLVVSVVRQTREIADQQH